MKLIIPVGIPGCGKSTFCQTWLFRYAETMTISSDSIRLVLFGKTYRADGNSQVFEQFHRDISKALVRYDVIADATNLEARARKKLYDIAEETSAYTHVLLFTNIEQALARNAARPVDRASGSCYVPDEVMRDKMIPRWEQTMRDIDAEPWDSLTKIESVDVRV